MASEKYSVKPYEGPIHHTEGQWQNVIGPNGHRLNLRPMPPDEANHLARILNSASSAAADEVGRLRRVAQKFIDDVDALRERSNREKRVLGGQRCTIVLIDDACEGIEAIRSALATDASGVMKHKEKE